MLVMAPAAGTKSMNSSHTWWSGAWTCCLWSKPQQASFLLRYVHFHLGRRRKRWWWSWEKRKNSNCNVRPPRGSEICRCRERNDGQPFKSARIEFRSGSLQFVIQV